ncbi:hypothetical protein NMY22_g10499 [Coprinellus aureogranulatus]|nr:hypothetical protein NMY22_g10499 [Coprinellus aureogranulatus]
MSTIATIVQCLPNLNPASDIDELPDEILADIFSFGSPIIDTHPKVLHGLILFTWMRVCRRWRSVAVSTPVLWSRVWLDVELFDSKYDSEEEAGDALEAFIQMCVQRSGGHLLDVGFGAVLPHYDRLPCIFAISYRFKSLIIEDHLLYIIAARPDFMGLEALRSLKVHSSGAIISGPLAVEFPQLINLQVRAAMSGALPFLSLAAPTLTHFSVDLLSYGGLRTLARYISAMASLTHLYLRLGSVRYIADSDSTENSPSDPLFDLLNIQKLWLTAPTNCAWSVLSRTHAPSLTDLRIEELSDRDDPVEDHEVNAAIERFVSSCPRNLHSFKADRMDIQRFRKVVVGLKPQIIALASLFDCADRRVNLFIGDIICNGADVAQVEEVTLFDGSRTGQFLLSLADALQDLSSSRGGATSPPSSGCNEHSTPKRVYLHSGGPISHSMLATLRSLFANGWSRRVAVDAYYSPGRAGRQCGLYDNYWERSEGLGHRSEPGDLFVSEPQF